VKKEGVEYRENGRLIVRTGARESGRHMAVRDKFPNAKLYSSPRSTEQWRVETKADKGRAQLDITPCTARTPRRHPV
jgi:hypothetical protein